jgi:glycerophosphoryl diester phosphodiesterase
MGKKFAIFGVAAAVTALSGYLKVSTADNDSQHDRDNGIRNIQVGPRPYFLVDDMDPSPLKAALKQCSEKPLKKTDFSIGHRGAGLQFPEHTKESYEAAARMGAGIVECDVTFTKDKQLVCRHATERPPHHDQYPEHAAGAEMHQGLYPGRYLMPTVR